MKVAAASLLAKSNDVSFLFRSSPRRRQFSCKRIGWPINSSGGGSRFQGVACGPPRACGAERDRTTHRLKVSLRRAGRSIGETSATPRALSCRAGWKACRCPRWPDHVADIETLLRMITAPSQGARFDRRGAGASLPKNGSLVFGTKRCTIKTLSKTSWVCRRGLC
jgi:hypothetical protein